MKTTLLIDMDALIYRYGLMRHEPGEAVFNGSPFVQAQSAIISKLQMLSDDFLGAEVRLGIMPPKTHNFRYDLYPKYKSKRKPPDPIIGELKAWVLEEFHDSLIPLPQEFSGETDDLLVEEHITLGVTNSVIVGIDKDFFSFMGWRYHPFTGELRWVSPENARLFHAYQCLVGDSTDGIPGAPGIGDKTAKRILVGAMGTFGGASSGEFLQKIDHIVHFAYLSTNKAGTWDYVTNKNLVDISRPYPERLATGYLDPLDSRWELPGEYKDLIEEITYNDD